MRVLALSTIACLCIVSLATQGQSPRVGSNWQHVQALPTGTTLEVNARNRNLQCNLTAVTEDSLSCAHGAKRIVFGRNEIASIKISRRGRSILIGAGVGGGALAIAGFAVTTNSSNGLFGSNFERGPITAVGALAGGVIGGGIGALTDFSRSTVYKAP